MPDVAAHREGNGDDGLKGFEKFCRSREAWGSVRDGNKGVVTVPSARSISTPLTVGRTRRVPDTEASPPLRLIAVSPARLESGVRSRPGRRSRYRGLLPLCRYLHSNQEQQPRPDRYLVLYCSSLTMQVKRLQSVLSPATPIHAPPFRRPTAGQVGIGSIWNIPPPSPLLRLSCYGGG